MMSGKFRFDCHYVRIRVFNSRHESRLDENVEDSDSGTVQAHVTAQMATTDLKSRRSRRKPGSPSSHMTHKGYGVSLSWFVFSPQSNRKHRFYRKTVCSHLVSFLGTITDHQGEDLRCFWGADENRGTFTSLFHREAQQDRALWAHGKSQSAVKSLLSPWAQI